MTRIKRGNLHNVRKQIAESVDVITLGALTDVSIVSVTDGEVLVYESASNSWRNRTFQEANIQVQDDLLDDIAALADPDADRLLFWDDSAATITWLTAGTGLTITGTTIEAAGGGGSEKQGASWYSGQAISVSDVEPISIFIPEAVTIAGAEIQTRGGTGTCTLDILLDQFSGAPQSIVSTNPPQISSGTSYTDTTLTGWTTSIPARSVLTFRVSGTIGFSLITILLEFS